MIRQKATGVSVTTAHHPFYFFSAVHERFTKPPISVRHCKCRTAGLQTFRLQQPVIHFTFFSSA